VYMESDIYYSLKPNSLIAKCAVPAVITSVFGAIYAVVDGIFVGRFLGENALASVNLIMPIIMIVESLANMIAIGASVNISILLGKKERENASAVFTTSIKVILFFSCIIGILGFAFAENFIRLISPGANAEAISMGTQYLKMYAIFSPLIPIYFAMDNFLRVCGKTELSMIIGIFSQVTNVILDFVLIAVLKKGVMAAAFASCISIAAGSIFMLLYFLGKKRDIYYSRNIISIKEFLHLISNGSSEFFSNISMSVMSIVMNLFLLKYGGTTAIAAFSIVMYVDSIIGMVNFGICDSIQPAISYCYGAKLIERLKDIYKRVVVIVFLVSVAAFLFMFILGPVVSRLFIKPSDKELMEVSYTAIKIFSISYLVGWIDMCLSSLFTSIDKPVQSLIVSLFGTLIFPIVFLFILTPIFGLNGIWIMSTTSQIASGIITIIIAGQIKKSMANNQIASH